MIVIKASDDISLAEWVYQTLKKQILEMKLRPGELLLIQRIANELDISRTPVREALARLRQEDLVVPAPGKKMKVSEFTSKDILEIYEVREGLEKMAAKLAAKRINESTISFIRKDFKRLKKALEEKDYDQFFEEDANFHHHIIEATNNSLIRKTLNGFDGRIQRIRYMTLSIKDRLKNTINEHREILENIIEGNEEAAATAMEYHLSTVKEEVYEMLVDYDTNLYSMDWLNIPSDIQKI